MNLVRRSSIATSPPLFVCPHSRSGNAAPKLIIGIVIFLVIFGGIKYATRAPEEITVLETKRVNGKDLSGATISMAQIQSILSSEAVSGLGGISARLKTRPPGLGDGGDNNDEQPKDSGTEGIDEKLISIEPDANGDFLLVRLRLSRDYLEKQGKISNLMAVVSTPDIHLTRSGGGSIDPIFLLSGVREESTTPKGPATQLNFGGGNTFTSYKPLPPNLWLATGQIKQAQELSGTVDVTCLFGRPPGQGDLALQILGTPNVPLQ